MAWVAGADVSTGDLISAATWNNYLGAAGSLEYLYDKTKLETAYKASDETVNNSSTLQNDDDLYFAIAANEVWGFHFILDYLSGTTPDIKFAVTVPSGATIAGGLLGMASGSVSRGMIRLSGVAVAQDGLGVTPGAHNYMTTIHGFVVNSTNAGNVQLQWAQNTANASDTKVLAGSHLLAHKLSS